MSTSFISPSIILFATLAGLPRGCDTHSSASSHMKAPGPMPVPLKSPGAHQRRGEGIEGVRRGGTGSGTANDRAIVAKNPTGNA